MSRDTSTYTTDDFLVSSIIGLTWANLFMGGMMILHAYGWMVL